MDNRALGSIVTQGNFLRIDHAFVDEVTRFNRNNGSVLISYSAPLPSGVTTAEQLQLNVNDRTTILNSFGLPVGLNDIREGTWIDATFSPRMTRSIPPQSSAVTIITRNASRPPAGPPTRPPQNPSTTVTARILWFDCNNNILVAGMPNNIGRITRYVVTNTTVILNRNGFPIRFCDLRPGQLVQITHANFMTAGIPPQTTAFRIQVL